jgi:hypothetical protein
MEFNKERFLLRLVAAVVISPLALYGIGAIACSVKYMISGSTAEGRCQPLQANLNRSTEVAMNVLLALLGGGALAVDAASNRPERKREDEPTRPVPPEQDPRF